MSKYIPSLIAAAAALAGIFASPVQGYVSAHPAIFSALSGVLAILSHFLPSPVAPAK